ncbi:hypothetical protein ACFE04_009694 [Oxalis oulophora]
MSPFLIYFISIAMFLYFLLRLRAGLSRPSRPFLPPGPKAWPIIGNLHQIGTTPHTNLAELARTYGPLMHIRLGFVDAIVVSSSSVASLFLKTHDANFSSRPRSSGAKYIGYNYHDLVFAPHGPRWRMLRKISSTHLFSGKALDSFRHVRQEEVAMLVQSIAKAKGSTKPVDLAQMLNLCTVNAIGRVMLGYRVFGDGTSKVDTKADEFKSMVVEMMVLSGICNVGEFIPGIEWLDLQGVVAKMKNVHKRFDTFLSEILEEHEKNHDDVNGKQKDLLSTLISLKDHSNDEDERLNNTDIKALLLNMFTAGTDTSSSTTEWAIAELIRHPKILARVQSELDTVVGRDRLVTEQDLPQLTYLQAVIKEAFRLHPSTPLSVPRVAAESCEVNGYHIPKGSTLLVNLWAIARDPEQWTDPLEFRPERFLPDGEKHNVDIRGNNFEVIPFGAGRRICVGMNLGLRMVQLMTASLVHGFDLGLGDGLLAEELNMEEAYGLTLQRAEPLLVYPKLRLLASVY